MRPTITTFSTPDGVQQGPGTGQHAAAGAPAAERPAVFVCHGDDGGPKMHPCRRVLEALRAKGIDHDKVIAGHGSPWPFLRRGSREQLRAATGATKLPVLKLPDGTVITHSKAILSWINRQQ